MISGCSDTSITEVDHDGNEDQPKVINEFVPAHNEPPKELVDEFGNKAERFMEKIYGLPWHELSQMEVSELPEIDSNLSSGEALEDWKELQGLIQELGRYDGAVRNVIRLNESFAAGMLPEDIEFGFYGSELRKTNGSCEDQCYAHANRQMANLYRSHWIASAECGGYASLATIFGTPVIGIATFGICGFFAILKYREAQRVIEEDMELCLMVCNMPNDGKN